MTAFRAPGIEAPTTQQAALAEAHRRRALRLPEGTRPTCAAWHPSGEHCTHPRPERDYDERRAADEGEAPYVDGEARAAREAGR